MGRIFKPGISYYRMDCGHILNKKVRLLFNEFGGDGYYIWSCLLDYGYGKWGYYFDLTDKDELELFTSEFCKMKITTVNEVISGCVRRGLFDSTVFDVSKVLTSDMMQDTFVIATSERRLKGTEFLMREKLLLLDFTTELPKNITIVPENYKIDHRNKGIDHRKNSHIREDKIIQEEIKEEKSLGALHPPAQLFLNSSGEKTNSSPEESKGTKKTFVPPTMEQVRDYFLTGPGNKQKPNPWPEDKCHNEAVKLINHYTANGWIQGQGKGRPIKDWKATCSQWVLREMENSVVARTNHESTSLTPAPVYNPIQHLQKVELDLNYLYDGFLEGKVTEVSIEWLQYDYLKKNGHIQFSDKKAQEIRDTVLEKYPGSKDDTLIKLMKRQGVIEYFKQLSAEGREWVFNPNKK